MLGKLCLLFFDGARRASGLPSERCPRTVYRDAPVHERSGKVTARSGFNSHDHIGLRTARGHGIHSASAPAVVKDTLETARPASKRTHKDRVIMDYYRTFSRTFSFVLFREQKLYFLRCPSPTIFPLARKGERKMLDLLDIPEMKEAEAAAQPRPPPRS